MTFQVGRRRMIPAFLTLSLSLSLTLSNTFLSSSKWIKWKERGQLSITHQTCSFFPLSLLLLSFPWMVIRLIQSIISRSGSNYTLWMDRIGWIIKSSDESNRPLDGHHFLFYFFSIPHVFLSLSISFFLTIFLHRSFFHLIGNLNNGNNNRQNISMNQCILRWHNLPPIWFHPSLDPKISSLSISHSFSLRSGSKYVLSWCEYIGNPEYKKIQKNLHRPMMDHLDHLSIPGRPNLSLSFCFFFFFFFCSIVCSSLFSHFLYFSRIFYHPENRNSTASCDINHTVSFSSLTFLLLSSLYLFLSCVFISCSSLLSFSTNRTIFGKK